MRLGILATHPIQYHAPLFQALAERLDLQVYYAHRQTAEGQAAAGFGVAFEWDVPLLEGYSYAFLHNRASDPDVGSSSGCDTPEIAHIIARERFDAFLVSGWYNRSYRQAIRACWRTGTPLMIRGDSQLLTPRSVVKRLAKEVLFRWFIPRFDRYLVVGERSREYYLHYGADPERMHFVPHFVDNTWFSTRARATRSGALRAELGLSDDTLLLLFVGKFIEEKRPADLFHAAAHLRQSGVDARAVYIGSGPMEETLRTQSSELGVTAHLLGFKNQSELPHYYAGADVLVLPSESETWGLVVNEAMACGLPAVVSDQVGCAPDLIEPGRTGDIFPVGDTPALANAIARLRPVLRLQRTKRALVAKMQLYSLETATEGVMEAIVRCSATAVSQHQAALEA
jgi:glycosyltransferase involved in cell wall biosynthesis